MEPAKETWKEQPREVGKKPGAFRRGYVKKECVVNSFRYCKETRKMNLRIENCPLNFTMWRSLITQIHSVERFRQKSIWDE